MQDDHYDTSRRHRRVEAKVDVRISTIEPETDPWTGRPFFRASHETCENLSRGGAFVITSEPLRPGRRVLLEIELPNGQPVEAIGRIAWSGKLPGAGAQATGIGVEFLGGSEEHFAALETFIGHDNAQERTQDVDGTDESNGT